jgi:hypothetical protein
MAILWSNMAIHRAVLVTVNKFNYYENIMQITKEWLEEFIRVRKQNCEFNLKVLAHQLEETPEVKEPITAHKVREAVRRDLRRQIAVEQGYLLCLRNLEFIISTDPEKHFHKPKGEPSEES